MKAIFAGSFDPPTLGHLDIIGRASAVFDEICVVVAVNSAKKCLFSMEERKSLLEGATEGLENVRVLVWDGLVVDCAKKIGAKVLLRGIRNFADFGYELDISILNRTIDAAVETVFFPADPKFCALRSHAVKELASQNADLSAFVPENVERALLQKFGRAAGQTEANERTLDIC